MSSQPDPAVRFAVVDVETSGLSVRRHRLLQVGIVTLDEHGAVLERWSTYVRPRRRVLFRVGPRHIHGIRRAVLRSAPPVEVVLDEIQRRVAGAVVVAHNASFDLAFLHDTARRAGRRLAIDDALCTLMLSRGLDPERRQSHRLAALCERYDVVLDRPHDALADADATAAVLPHLLAARQLSTIGLVRAEAREQAVRRAQRARAQLVEA